MIEVKIQFPNTAAAIAFLSAGEQASPACAQLMDSRPVDNAAVTVVVTNVPAEPAEATAGNGKKGKAKDKPAATDSAATADVDSAAQPKADAATPASETKAASPEIPTYDKTDLPARIMAIVKGQTKKPALVNLLGEFGVKSGKELKPEQLADFGAALAVLEKAPEPEADLA